MVETAKRILTKERIDGQLAGQSSSTPFISIKDSYNERATFDTQDGFEDKIDRRAVMMGKLTTRDNGTKRQFKPQIYQSKRREQSRNVYDTHNYDRGNDQNRYRSNSRHMKIQFSGHSRGRPRYEQNLGMIVEEKILEVTWECIKILEDRIEEDIEEIIGMKIITEKAVGVGLDKDNFQGILIIEEMTEA